MTVVRQPDLLSLAELGAQLAGARLVVGLDSSAMAHGILAIEDGGGMVVISPANRHNNTFKDWCDPLGLSYGVVIASEDGDGYRVDEGDLQKTMDLVLQASASLEAYS